MAVVEQRNGARRLRGTRHLGDGVFRGVSIACGALIVLAALALVAALVKEAWPALTSVGLRVLGGQTWDPNHGVFGALAFIYGTVVSSLIALVLAAVVGIMIAVFLVEMAPPALGRPVSFLVEMLAAVPSIVFGLWGIYVLIPHIIPFESWLNGTLGFIPIFGGTPSAGGNLFIAGLILAVMILPTIAAISRDVMAAVPLSQREGMLALGATRWEVVRLVVLPYARAGIIGALILGLGRAVGETMAATMVIGNDPHVHLSLLAPGYSIAALLANESGEAFSTPLYIGALFELGLLLLLISVALNTLARLLVWRVSRGTRTVTG